MTDISELMLGAASW